VPRRAHGGRIFLRYRYFRDFRIFVDTPELSSGVRLFILAMEVGFRWFILAVDISGAGAGKGVAKAAWQKLMFVVFPSSHSANPFAKWLKQRPRLLPVH
jgi:hypothetical protein